MKKAFPLFAIVFLFFSCDTLQELGQYGIEEYGEQGLSESEVIAGLKEALEVGISNASSQLSALDGFNLNPEVHIPFMEDAKEVESKLRQIGLGFQVDKFETQLNRAAESASSTALPIFKNAILNMSFSDAWGILKSEDPFAATNYLKATTSTQLHQAFRPKINKAIEDVELTKYWEPLATAYNTLPFTQEKVTVDLEQYVLDETTEGLFLMLSKEEEKIRKDPAARVSELLKKVFGNGN